MLQYWLRYVPLMRSLLAFLAGVTSATLFVIHPFVFLFFGLLVLVTILFFFRHASYRYGWIPGVLILLVFFLFGNSYTRLRSVEACICDPLVVDVSGYVIDRVGVTSKAHKLEFFADTMSCGDVMKLNRKGIIYYPNELVPVPECGQELRFKLRLMPFKAPDNPGMFNYPQYLLRHGFSFMGYVDPQSVVMGSGVRHGLAVGVARLKDAIVNIFSIRGVDALHLGLLQSFFLGDKSELDPIVKRAFMNSGTMHLLAVSGMHVGIIYLLILKAFSAFDRKGWRLFRFSAIILSLWMYGVLTGLSPSVLRAIVMMTVLETGRTFQRETSILNLLVVAMFTILLIDPFSIYSAGLWLSFSAVCGIVFLYPVFNRVCHPSFPPFRWIWSLVAVSVAAQIGTLPFSLYYFHAFPVYFLLNNLILVPLLAPVLFLCLLLLAFSPFPFLSEMFAGVLNDLLLFIGRYVVFAEQMPASVIKYIPFDRFDLLLLLVMLFLLYWLLNQFNYKMLITGVLMVTLFLSKQVVYNLYWSPRCELAVFNAPRKMLMVVTTPSHTKVFVSDDVVESDIDYVASGYLSQAGFKAPQIVRLRQSVMVNANGFKVAVIVERHSWDVDPEYLHGCDAVVLAGDAWPPGALPADGLQRFVFSSALKPAVRKRWHSAGGMAGINMWDVTGMGAYVLTFNQ